MDGGSDGILGNARLGLPKRGRSWHRRGRTCPEGNLWWRRSFRRTYSEEGQFQIQHMGGYSGLVDTHRVVIWIFGSTTTRSSGDLIFDKFCSSPRRLTSTEVSNYVPVCVYFGRYTKTFYLLLTICNDKTTINIPGVYFQWGMLQTVWFRKRSYEKTQRYGLRTTTRVVVWWGK